MSNIHQQLAKISPELLQQMFEFAGRAMNNVEAITEACKEHGITLGEGMAYAKTFADIGINGEAEILTVPAFQALLNDINDVPNNLRSAGDVFLREDSWQKVLDTFSGVKDLTEPYHRTAKALLCIIFRCIDTKTQDRSAVYSADDILSLTDPLTLIKASVSLYISTDNDQNKGAVDFVIGNLPGFILSKAANEMRLGLDLTVSGVILEKLGFLTIQIESTVRDFKSLLA